MGFDASLLLAAVTEFLQFIAPEKVGEVIPRLELLQKMLKYGVPSAASSALCELGFHDRALALDLSSALGVVNDQRHEVIRRLRDVPEIVTEVLSKYPSYFSHISDKVI